MAAGPVLTPTNAASINGSWGISWANTGNIVASDNSRSTYTFNGIFSNQSAYSSFLYASAFNAGLPSNAVIQGIQISVEAQQSGGSTGTTSWNTVSLSKTGSTVGTNKGNTTVIPTVENIRTFGGPTDLWGTTWTAADVNASTFGVMLRPIASVSGGNRVVGVDQVTITIYYTATTIIIPDTESFVQTAQNVFVANGDFFFAEVGTTAFIQVNPQVNVPETIALTATPLMTMNGLNTSALNYTSKDTGEKFFTYLLPGTVGQNQNWSNIQNALVADGSVATISGMGGLTSRQPLKYLMDDIGLPRIDGTVKGIQVNVIGGATWSGSQIPFIVNFGNVGTGKSATYTTSGVNQTLVLGGPTDNWGISSLATLASVPALYHKTSTNAFSSQTDVVDAISIQVWYSVAEPYVVAGCTALEVPDTPSATLNANFVNGTGSSGGTYQGWANPSYITEFDTLEANATVGSNALSSAFVKNFSEFDAIPTNATITGVHVEFAGSGPSNGITWVATRPTSTGAVSLTSVTWSSSQGGNPGQPLYSAYFPVNWEPGTYDGTGVAALQANGTVFGSGAFTTNYFAVRLDYAINVAEQVPVLPFVQSLKDVGVLAASAVQVDTKQFAFTRFDVNVKLNDRIAIPKLAFAMSSLPVNLNAKTLIQVNTKAFAQTSFDAYPIESTFIDVVALSFVMSGLDAKVNGVEKISIPAFTFTQNSLDVKVNEKQFISPRSFTMNGLPAKISDGVNVGTFNFTMTSFPVAVVEKQFISTLNFTMTALNAEATSSIIPEVLNFTMSGLDINVNNTEKLAIPSFEFTMEAKDVKLNERLNVVPFSFAMSGLDININQNEIVVAPKFAFAMFGLDININEGTAIVPPVLNFVMSNKDANVNAIEHVETDFFAFNQSAFDVSINETTMMDVEALGFTMSGLDINVNERMYVGVKAFVQTAYVVNINDRVNAEVLRFEQNSFEVQLNEALKIGTLNFEQTAHFVKVTEVLNTIGTLDFVQTTYEISLPNMVSVEALGFTMSSFEIATAEAVNIAVLDFIQTMRAPLVYNDILPIFNVVISWDGIVEGPEGTGAMFKRFSQEGVVEVGQRIKYFIPEPTVLSGRLEMGEIPVVVEV